MSTQAARSYAGIFMFDPDAETMPREALSVLQTTRLKHALQRAYADVPHYRSKWEAAKVGPDAFRSLSDIARFPFTTKADLRDTYPFGMFAVPREDLRRLHASSGTTGKPTVVGYTKGDLECWSELMARSLACAGALPGDIVHNAYGYGLFTGGLGVHYGAEARLHSGAGIGRRHRAPGGPAAGLRRPCAVRDAVLRAQHRRSRRRHGGRFAPGAAAHRRVRRRALERRGPQRARGALRDQGGRSLRPFRSVGTRRCLRMSRRAGRAARLGGSFPVRDH